MTENANLKEMASALAEFSRVFSKYKADGMPAVVALYAQIAEHSDVASVIECIEQGCVDGQELLSSVKFAAENSASSRDTARQAISDENVVNFAEPTGLAMPQGRPLTVVEDIPSPKHDSIVPEPVETVEPSKAARRVASKMFDFMMLDAPRHHASVGNPIGMKNLFSLGFTLDQSTKRGSHTAKLNRWKGDGYLHWIDAADITLTDLGEIKRKDLLRFLTEKQKDEVRAAYKAVFRITPSLE